MKRRFSNATGFLPCGCSVAFPRPPWKFDLCGFSPRGFRGVTPKLGIFDRPAVCGTNGGRFFARSAPGTRQREVSNTFRAQNCGVGGGIRSFSPRIHGLSPTRFFPLKSGRVGAGLGRGRLAAALGGRMRDPSGILEEALELGAAG